MKIRVDGLRVTDKGIAKVLERALVSRKKRAANPDGEVKLSSNSALAGLDRNHDGVYDAADFRKIFGVETKRSQKLWGNYQRAVEFLQQQSCKQLSSGITFKPSDYLGVDVYCNQNYAKVALYDFREYHYRGYVAFFELDGEKFTSEDLTKDEVPVISIPLNVLTPGVHEVRIGAEDSWILSGITMQVGP